MEKAGISRNDEGIISRKKEISNLIRNGLDNLVVDILIGV